MSAGRVVNCIRCDGKGYVWIKTLVSDQIHPRECNSCDGSGKQTVRA